MIGWRVKVCVRDKSKKLTARRGLDTDNPAATATSGICLVKKDPFHEFKRFLSERYDCNRNGIKRAVKIFLTAPPMHIP